MPTLLRRSQGECKQTNKKKNCFFIFYFACVYLCFITIFLFIFPCRNVVALTVARIGCVSALNALRANEQSHNILYRSASSDDAAKDLDAWFPDLPAPAADAPTEAPAAAPAPAAAAAEASPAAAAAAAAAEVPPAAAAAASTEAAAAPAATEEAKAEPEPAAAPS